MNSYISFLFNTDDASIKSRYAPVVYPISGSNSFKLAYSIPGYHSPRQYFSFSSIPSSFPNRFVADIFHFFSITPSFLFYLTKPKSPKPKLALVKKELGIYSKPIRSFSQDEIDVASYNLNLAISLARKNHSLFFFDSYLQAYKILHPNLHYSSSTVKSILSDFAKLIS